MSKVPDVCGSAGCNQENESRGAGGGAGSQLCPTDSRKTVLLFHWCSVDMRGKSFFLPQIAKLQERGKLAVFSSWISGSNDLLISE